MRCRALIAIALLVLVSSTRGDDHPPLAKVWIFTAVDCPIANGYSPELNRILEEYGRKRVDFVLIYPEPSISEDDILNHRADYALTIPALHDPEHLRVKKAGATTTPEVAVFDQDDQLVYRGKIDDRYTEFGDRRNSANETFLRDVLDRLIKGEKVAFHSTESIGCFIESLP